MQNNDIVALAIVSYIFAIFLVLLLVSRAEQRPQDPEEDAAQMAAIAAKKYISDVSRCHYPECCCSWETMISGCGSQLDLIPLPPQRAPAPVTDGPATPPETITVDGCSPPILVGPPVAVKMTKMVLLIERCSDPFRWYAGMIGKEVPYLGEFPFEECFKSREPAGYINVVKYSDARIILKGSK